jgi:hypothetical protein
MKRLILAILLFVVLLVAYWVWPFIGLGALASSLQTRNTAALSQQVDFGRLRRHLAGQIITTYLRITGRDKKLGPLGALAPAIGASIVDPWLAQIVNPENLVELLRGGTISSELGPISFHIGDIPKLSLGGAWTTWMGSEYGLGRFLITLPADAEPAEQFRLRMQLLQWHWKLTEIDLPEKLRNQVARELATKYR